MEREVATRWQDRPHKARLDRGSAVCECGRSVLDELHSIRARELADAHSQPGLATEKGS